MVKFTLLTAFAAIALHPAVAVAANSCAVPTTLPTARAEFPPPGTMRKLPVTGHVLALSWSPQFCKSRLDDDDHDGQCQARPAFGFILHGLWPDAQGSQNPQYCRRVDAPPREVIRQTYCATPSVDLIVHEWAKHGSCIARDAAGYFRSATAAFESITPPDMMALSLQSRTVEEVTSAFTARNPDLPRSAVRITVSKLGWLEEVRICLGVDMKPRACPRDIGGAGPTKRLRIWRAAS